MKNIHVLPTDKPSRLVLDTVNKNLFLTTTKDFGTKIMQFQNIYITSDEEIKKGDWCINLNSPYAHKELCKIDNQLELERYVKKTSNNCKKIILTTDQDLIKDGVQAIDDEFLEWFVKNPSYESVEVKKRYSDFTVDPFVGYKIIIPQEDPFEKSKLALRAYLLANKEKVTNDLQEMREKSSVDRNETVEEAAETWVFETNGHKWSNNDDTAGDNYGSFMAGAEWQSERGYSEEEVEKMVRAAYTFGEKEFKYFGAFKEWFKQFKKK
jgi:hypothetical protein